MEKSVTMSRVLYVKRLVRVAIVSVILTIVAVVLVCINYNWVFKDPIASQSGISILIESDEPVRIPKGFIVEGNAEQLIELDGVLAIERIVTPYVAIESMVIKCSSGSNSICILYPPEYGTVNYDHKDLVKKILNILRK